MNLYKIVAFLISVPVLLGTGQTDLATVAEVIETEYALVESAPEGLATPEAPSAEMVDLQENVPLAPIPFVSSDESITFSYEYVADEDGVIIPYGLFTPSSAEFNEKTPLIVWLHGSGERNVSQTSFENTGLPYVLKRWTLHGFNAYVVCPQLYRQFDTGLWMKDEAVDNLKALLQELTTKYNIDPERIILTGHSLGGQGSTYIASKMPDVFSCVAVLSGYDCYMDLPIDVPVCGYVGSTAYGESSTSHSYMTGDFRNEYPTAEVYVLNSSHGDLPWDAFNRDLNKDNKSDLIEWMLNRTKPKNN